MHKWWNPQRARADVRHWCAFRLQPEPIEFWPSGWQRLRERLRCQKSADGQWSKIALNP